MAAQDGQAQTVKAGGTVVQKTNLNNTVSNKGGKLKIGTIEGKTDVGGSLNQTTTVNGAVNIDGGSFLGLGAAPEVNIGRINSAKVGGALDQNTTINGTVNVKTGGAFGLGAKSKTNVGVIDNVDIGGKAVSVDLCR